MGTVSELLEGIQGPAARAARVRGRVGRAGAGAPTCFRRARRGLAGPLSGDGPTAARTATGPHGAPSVFTLLFHPLQNGL